MISLKSRLIVGAIGVALLAPASAMAAHSWVLPSTTILSGGNAWVTVDAATSDALFFPNLRALPLASLKVTDSEGQPAEPANGAAGRLRATIDVQLTKPGTYKVASTSSSVLASWTENGEVKRFRGTGEDFAKQVPAGAADLKTIRTVNRNETFITRDNPTRAVFKTTGEGLELEPVTHPADVVAGEAATFRLLLDGKPASGLEVVFERGSDIWKAKTPAAIKLTTKADGQVTVTLPEAGVWLLTAAYRTGENGRGGPPPGAGGPPPGPGGPGAPRPAGAPPPPAQPLAGDGYMANYTVTLEAQLP